ncbi:hypothetical protein CF326_g4946 [Tilletia indica]|nr:hypothetical protein CF326_g4946 [Tilletia indica]
MLSADCVEWDESHTESELDEEQGEDRDGDSDQEKTKGKTIRAVMPEWWSQENMEFQKQIDGQVPKPLGSYRIQAASGLQMRSTPLSKAVPRIAVSLTWATANPKLVRSVSKNVAPFKPHRRGIANNAEEWGTPIENAAVQGQGARQISLAGEGGEGGEGGEDGEDGEDGETGDAMVTGN